MLPLLIRQLLQDYKKPLIMRTTGYSETPLAKKLGIKNNFKIRLVNAPEYYLELFTDMPEQISILDDTKVKKNFIHYFATNKKKLQNEIAFLKREITDDGIIWISWHKKSSNIITDVTENIIRGLALANGLVDIKVCAVDELWSGLKLVIPIKFRNVPV